MKGKRILSAILAGMTVVSLSACSGGSTSSSSGSAGGTSPAASTTGGQASAGGSSASQDSGKRGSISVTVYDRGKVPASEGTIEENRWTKWINENGPVDVKFVAIPRTDSGEKLNVLFASGTAPDLILEYSPAVKTPLYQQKQLMPLDDVIEQYSTNYKQLMEEYPSLKKAGAMDDGKIYQFGRINSVTPIRGVAIRQDWLDKLGLKAPDTLDDYYQVAKAFTEDDPDGNGQKDTHGIALSYRAGETFNQMIPGNEICEINGDMDYGWDRIKIRLDFKKKLYDEGIVDKEYMTDKNGARAMQEFVNGKLGMLPWLYTFDSFLKTEYKTLKDNVPEASITFIPYPETGYGRFMPTLQNPVQMTAVVNAACKDPESVMKYVDFACSEEFARTMKYGIEGTHYQLQDGKAIITDQDKYQNEVGWAGDFSMLVNAATLAPYLPDYAGFNMDDPFEKECYDIYKAAMKLYLDPTLQYADLTHSEHMPQLPKELSTINANIDLNSFFDKAVVSGGDYTVDQAIADAQAAWEKGEGEKILQWWKDWYANDRQNAFLAKDMFEIMEKENLVGNLK